MGRFFVLIVIKFSVDYKLIFLTGQVIYKGEVFLTVYLCGPSVSTCRLLMDCEEVNTNLWGLVI